MLSRSNPCHRAPCPDTSRRSHGRQDGVVLFIALIVLVALTLGGIALVRSVGTTNIIAGNLAFQKAATLAAEAGIEAAIRTIENGNLAAMSKAELQADNFARGYAASTPAADNPADWDAYWSATIDPNPRALPVTAFSCSAADGRGGRSCTLPTDAASNTVTYTIQRLCETAGDPLPLPTGCAAAPAKNALSGNSLGSGRPPLMQVTQYYYRITSRVVGPRNTVSYVQTIVAR